MQPYYTQTPEFSDALVDYLQRTGAAYWDFLKNRPAQIKRDWTEPSRGMFGGMGLTGDTPQARVESLAERMLDWSPFGAAAGITTGVRRGAARQLVPDEVAKHGVTQDLTHYTKAGDINTLDPAFYGTRGGSQVTNQEYGAVMSGDLPRMYAYGPTMADTPEHMVAGGRRIDFRQHDLYDTVKDPLDLHLEAKRRADVKAAKSKYPYTPPQTEVAKEFNKLVKERGFVGTYNPTVDQAMLFEKVDLKDMPERFTRLQRRKALSSIKQGGYSQQPVSGRIPTEGYMVGYFPAREQVMPINKLTQAEIEKYLKKNESVLQNPQNYFGGWGDEGQAYLDVSRWYPSTGKDALRKAMYTADTKEQKAIYDLTAGQDIDAAMLWQDFIHSPEFTRRLEQGYDVGERYMRRHKPWWEIQGSELEEVYGPEAKQHLAALMAATSTGTPLRSNIQQTTEYMRRLKAGEPLAQPAYRLPVGTMSQRPGTWMPMEESRVPNLMRIDRGDFDALQKEKVLNMYQAGIGDPNALALDRYWARAAEDPLQNIFVGPNSLVVPSKTHPMHGTGSPRYGQLKSRVIEMTPSFTSATPAQFGADVWTGWREMAKRDRSLFGIRIPQSVDLGDSKGLQEHFTDLLTEKAKFLGIPRNVLKERIKAGDANLMSALLGLGTAGALGAAATEESESEIK